MKKCEIDFKVRMNSKLEMLIAKIDLEAATNAHQREVILLLGSVYDRVEEFVESHKQELLEEI